MHRIGRTGRAGRNGLAVTLAERMDAGMIRPHPAVHDAAHPGGDDRRPRAEEPRAAHVRPARRRAGGASAGQAGRLRSAAREGREPAVRAAPAVRGPRRARPARKEGFKPRARPAFGR